jgi:hypothetical protein
MVTYLQTTLPYTLIIMHKTHTPTCNNFKTQKTYPNDPTYKTHGNKNIHNLSRKLIHRQWINESTEDRLKYLEVGRQIILEGKQTQSMGTQ